MNATSGYQHNLKNIAMRPYIICSIVLNVLAISVVSAQSPIAPPTLIDESAVNDRLQTLKAGRITTANKKNITDTHSLLCLPMQTPVGRNNMFNVYVLPLDNMLCLVPNNTHEPSNRIMNAFVKRD